MPDVRCHTCGQDMKLDLATYLNYKGSVTCEHCKVPQYIETAGGGLVTSSLIRDLRLVQGMHLKMPPQLYIDFGEAWFDLQNKCYKSCAVMCRRCVQGLLFEKGIPDGRPKEMIEKAAEKGILTPQMKALADTVTFFGNWGAHPKDQELTDAGELEATQGLLVTKRIILHVFPEPAPPQPSP